MTTPSEDLPEDPQADREDSAPLAEDRGAEDRSTEDRILTERFLAARNDDRRPDMEQAFRMLLIRYQERVQKLVYRYTRDAIEAEDVCQEVFVKVYRKLDSFQGESAFFTWLYRIAVNTASDWMAKRKRRPVHLSEDVSVLMGAGDQIQQTRHFRGPKPAEAPDAALLQEERAQVTRDILEDLPENYRRVLILREYEDMSYNDMAEVLQCSLGTVESRLFRARARFRKVLEERHPELLR